MINVKLIKLAEDKFFAVCLMLFIFCIIKILFQFSIILLSLVFRNISLTISYQQFLATLVEDVFLAVINLLGFLISLERHKNLIFLSIFASTTSSSFVIESLLLVEAFSKSESTDLFSFHLAWFRLM